MTLLPEETLYCSEGKAAYGISLGTPSEYAWSSTRIAPPFSVCVFCSSPEDEEDERNVRNQEEFLQESCTYFGKTKHLKAFA